MTAADRDAHVQLLDDPEDMVSQRRRSSTENENDRIKMYSKVTQIKKKQVHLKNNGHFNPTPELTTFGGNKLGWIQGVLIPCLLNIWGVMLFLRISWIVGQAGIGLTMVIIFLSGVVCVITTLSLSAICTNGELQGGGVYYLVSRSLGAELGASVGIIFAFANAVAATMNTIGFCESLNELLQKYGLKILDNGVNDTRIVGAIALLLMCIICAIGMDWETKTQNFLITIIVLAIINYIMGASLGPTSNKQIAQGFVGINMENAKKNWSPDYRYSEGSEHNFFSVFAMYFPAVTGVQAGANICGDLKNPATAIPKGTLLALAISTGSYIALSLLAGVGALRDASGDTTNLTLTNLEACKPNCTYGLHNNYEVMQLMASWGPLIYGGCWAATLSTAPTNLLSVPRLIQALGVDRIYPGLIFFSKPYGKHGEPYRGYVLVFIVSLFFLLIADLNTIAPLITNFYLASYALINFCTFHAGAVQAISWRPTFRYYNSWLSLAGFILCVCIMMIISWMMALVTTFIFMTLYLLVLYTKPDATWGSSTEAHRYYETVSNILQISRKTRHIKSYNPQLLVLAGKPYLRPALLDVGNLITNFGSFMIVADVEQDEMPHNVRINQVRLGEEWIQSRKHRAFFVLLTGISMERGVKALAQSAGLGRLEPNIMLIGFMEKWQTCSHEQLATYVRVIQSAIDEQLAITIFRPLLNTLVSIPTIGKVIASSPSVTRGRNEQCQSQLVALMHSNSDIEDSMLEHDGKKSTTSASSSALIDVTSRKRSTKLPINLSEFMLNTDALKPLSLESPLDTWWLYDDGGLNILLPYIIARRGLKGKKPLRIFALPRAGYKEEDTMKNMKELLSKYRIDYTKLVLLRGISDAPSVESWELFENLSARFKSDQKESDTLITESEIINQSLKTCRNLRLRELLLEHSSDASLIVMSAPLPRKGLVSAALYMVWLEILSKDLPSMLFVRGNDVPVLDA